MTTIVEENGDIVEASQVHWSTGTILTIFFAASLVAALFFGLGFTFGPGRMAAFAENGPSEAAATPSTQASEPPRQTASTSANIHRSISPRYPSTSAPGKVKLQAVSATENVRSSAVPATFAKSRIAQGTGATNQAAGTRVNENRYMVQIGAIGDRKDALTLVSQLRRQGFHAAIYPGVRDKFLHVQLGPFAGVQQAQAVRHRVIAHGYRAMLKPAI